MARFTCGRLLYLGIVTFHNISSYTRFYYGVSSISGGGAHVWVLNFLKTTCYEQILGVHNVIESYM